VSQTNGLDQDEKENNHVRVPWAVFAIDKQGNQADEGKDVQDQRIYKVGSEQASVMSSYTYKPKECKDNSDNHNQGASMGQNKERKKTIGQERGK